MVLRFVEAFAGVFYVILFAFIRKRKLDSDLYDALCQGLKTRQEVCVIREQIRKENKTWTQDLEIYGILFGVFLSIPCVAIITLEGVIWLTVLLSATLFGALAFVLITVWICKVAIITRQYNKAVCKGYLNFSHDLKL